MATLFAVPNPADALPFPDSLTEKYRPRAIDAFVGLDAPRALMRKLAARPYSSAWRFVGPTGTGKTTLALALAESIGAELHHIPSQKCDLSTIERVCASCNYVPLTGGYHIVLVDEADEMTHAAQTALLSRLDSTNFPPHTIFIFTCNATDKLQDRFLSRTREVKFSSYGMASDVAQMLDGIWQAEAPKTAKAPNFLRIVKEENNNVRGSLMRLETELLLAE